MNREIKCPGCGETTTWSGNPHRPFCSERCRLVDLGCWADGEYRIPGPAQDPMENSNVISITDKLQDIER